MNKTFLAIAVSKEKNNMKKMVSKALVLIFAVLAVESMGIPVPDNVCMDWVEPIWEELTPGGGDRPVVESDFLRICVLMSQNGECRVNKQEFTAWWQPKTLMSTNDCSALFMNWTSLGGNQNTEYITVDVMRNVFSNYDQDGDDVINKVEFVSGMMKTIENLPDKGCRCYMQQC